MSELSYPIGKFDRAAVITDEQRPALIEGIATLPERLRVAVAGLSDEQLDTPYRPGGWTVRQLVHHVADSHINAYTRFRLALTEDEPTIKPYDEARWAELEDAKSAPIGVSLALLDAIHKRWETLLRALSSEAFARTFRHPELGVMTINSQLGLYDWHGRHHVAHATSLKKRMNW